MDDRAYRQLFDLIPLGLGVVTDDLQIIETNRAMADLLGYAPAELIGRSIRDLADDSASLAVRADRPVQTMMTKFHRKDGVDVFGKVTAVRVGNESNEPACLFVIAEDLTEQARLDGVLQTMRETTHQVSNALTEAQGYTQLALLQNDLPPPALELLTLAMNSFDTVTTYLQSLRRIWLLATGGR